MQCRNRIIAVLAFSIVACSQGVERTQIAVPETEGGLELAAALNGTWQIVSRQKSTCPAHLVLNPFDGRVLMSSDQTRVLIEALDFVGLRLTLSAASSNELKETTTLSADGCTFQEAHTVVFETLTATRVSAAYTLEYAWSDEKKCRDAIAMYANGIDEPCTLESTWTGTRLDVD